MCNSELVAGERSLTLVHWILEDFTKTMLLVFLVRVENGPRLSSMVKFRDYYSFVLDFKSWPSNTLCIRWQNAIFMNRR